MDYPWAKFGDFSFSRFAFVVRTDRQTDRITEADDRYTHATTVGVSNNYISRNTRTYGLSPLSTTRVDGPS